MPRYCDQCGAEIKDGFKFCGKCGEKIRVKEEIIPIENEPVIVSEPGTDTSSVIEPSPEQKTNLLSSASTTETTSNEENTQIDEGKRSYGKWIAVGLSIVLLVLVIIFLVLRQPPMQGTTQDTPYVPPHQTTVSFEPIKDSCITAHKPTLAIGYADNMTLRGPSGWELQPLVQFDLSSIPRGSTINNAYLRLYYYSNHDGNPSGQIYNAYRITSSWSEQGVNWNNQPTAVSYRSASTSCPSYTDTWITWDLVSDVQGIVSGNYPNYGWIIKVDSGNNAYAYVASREASSHHPTLEVVYTTYS